MQDYQNLWDNRYGGGKYIFGKNPNVYFKEKLLTLDPKNIFLPGDGEGRNAIFAAKNGWNVTSVDFSKVALDRAKEFAIEEKVEINFQFKDLIKAELPNNKYDVVGISFLHFNGKNKKIVHEKLSDSIKVGGYLILECFGNRQVKLNSGGPRKKDSLYTINELKKYYKGFDFLEAEDILTQLHEGQGHEGDGYVVRLFAQKKEQKNE